jgi:hypothetical protein
MSCRLVQLHPLTSVSIAASLATNPLPASNLSTQNRSRRTLKLQKLLRNPTPILVPPVMAVPRTSTRAMVTTVKKDDQGHALVRNMQDICIVDQKKLKVSQTKSERDAAPALNKKVFLQVTKQLKNVKAGLTSTSTSTRRLQHAVLQMSHSKHMTSVL